jgi:hypothetical protein
VRERQIDRMGGGVAVDRRGEKWIRSSIFGAEKNNSWLL